MKKSIYILTLILLTFTGYSQDSTMTQPKNAVYATIGSRSMWTALNYERVFWTPQKRPIELVGNVGFGHNLKNGFTVPTQIEVRYGRKFQVGVFGGIISQFNYDPEIDTKEKKEDYLFNPENEYRIGATPSLPYDLLLSTGVNLRATVKKRWLFQFGGSVNYLRTPDYRTNRKWEYNFWHLLADFGIGYKF